ncbi:unnamed protein product [Staurois parvus]|uniref:Uncharacterized protein n=1 Tax=Staurois parvus TaxID=386267 RepID=A0ABN9HBY0_9NEOB|nr:unnamed protein product [Staurois parvus]
MTEDLHICYIFVLGFKNFKTQCNSFADLSKNIPLLIQNLLNFWKLF